MQKKSFKDILNTILSPEQKVALKKEFADIPVVAPVAPEAVVTPDVAPVLEKKLKDGTVIKFDTPTLEVGSTVMVVGLDGTELPAPDGQHEVEDGTLFTIVNGIVTELIPVPASVAAPEVPAAPAAEVPMAVATPSPLLDELKKLIESRFSANESEVNTLKGIVADQAKALQAFQSFFNNLIETPTATPIAEGNEFSSKKAKKLNKFIKS